MSWLKFTQVTKDKSGKTIKITTTSYRAFSGKGSDINDPKCTCKKGKGPLPKGKYYIVDRVKSRNPFKNLGKGDWFALYADDGTIDDYTTCPDGTTKRGNFRFHPGQSSEGCLTLPNEDQFDKVRDLLENTSSGVIPGTSTKYYGTITVK